MSGFDDYGRCLTHQRYACSACMVEERRQGARLDREARMELLLERIATALERLVPGSASGGRDERGSGT